MRVVEADETPTATAARRSTGDEGERSIADEDEAAVGDDVKVCMLLLVSGDRQAGRAVRGSGRS